MTFVYFRSWYLRECTDFEENILKSPDVLAESRKLVCVPLDYDWDRDLARDWGLDAVPAYVLVSPSGEVLSKAQHPIAPQQLLQDIRAALASQSTAAKPETTGAATP